MSHPLNLVHLAVFLPASCALLSIAAPAVDITDDFNDGNDTGWTQSDLIGAAIGGDFASFAFPGGTAYEISVPSQGINSLLGPARAGSYRSDVVYKNKFKHSVDILDFDSTSTPDQDLGLLALLSDLDPGIGTLDGYSFSYDTNAGEVFVVRLTDEMPSGTYARDAGAGILTDGNNYRFVFQGFFFNGLANFRGEIYDASLPGGFDDPANPIYDAYAQNISTADAIYDSGIGSVFCAAQPDLFPSSPAGATYDNYCSTSQTDVDRDGVADEFELALINQDGNDLVDFLSDVMGSRENPQSTDFDGDGDDDERELITGSDATDASETWKVSMAEIDGGNLKVTFPVVANRSYSLACNTDLNSPFIVDASAVFASGDGFGTLSVPIAAGHRFCRVIVEVSDPCICTP